MRHITLIIAVLTLTVAAPAIAGKGGTGNGNGGSGSGGGGGNGGGSTSAWLSITPIDAAAWSRVWGSGCGYDANTEVYVDVEKPSALMFSSAMADSAGCIAFTFTTDAPGTYHASARQQGNGGHWTMMATYDLPVV
jgi:hypothetical protein